MSEHIDQDEHPLISANLEVEQLDVTLYRSKSLFIPENARGVFGGQVISQALVSATKTVDPAYTVHSLHCYFLLSASASIPLIYFVEKVRHGRTYTTRSVKASQSGKLVFIMICSFQKPEPRQLSLQVPMPDVPNPDVLVPDETRFHEASVNEKDPKLRDILINYRNARRRSPIEIRAAGEKLSDDGVYTRMWWMRVRGSRGMPDKFEQSFQKCILAYISDLNFVSTVARTLGLTRTGPRRQTMGSSLDHSIFYYSDDIDCADWILYVMTSPVANSGRGVVIGHLYAQGGKLIAVTTQEGLARIDPKLYDEASQEQEEFLKARL